VRASLRSVGTILVGGAIVCWLGVAAMAQEEPSTTVPASEEITTTVVVPEPAVPVSEEPEEEPNEAWTTVYLVPTALLIGAGTVLITIVMYFIRVTRARYRPQE